MLPGDKIWKGYSHPWVLAGRIFGLAFFQAGLTDAEEVGKMSLDLSLKGIFSQNIDMADIFHFQIHNTAAIAANYMVMGSRIPIEAVCAYADGNLLDLSQVGQQGKVPVNRAKADIGK